jgi:hypothetical protein
MAWAVWLGDRQRGVRAHVQFEVLKQTAAHVHFTPGAGAENECLKAHLQPGRLYVMDRGFRDFALFQKIVDAGSSFVVRLGQNAVYEVLEEKPLTPEARAAGGISDRIVRLGWHKIRHKLDRPVRLVAVQVPQSAPRGLGYPVKQVDPKTKSCRVPAGQAMTVLIATDRLDLPADVIALIYKHRYQVELFFRLLKATLGCRHLMFLPHRPGKPACLKAGCPACPCAKKIRKTAKSVGPQNVRKTESIHSVINTSACGPPERPSF